MNSDTHLLEQARSGDQRALRILFENHVNSLYRFLRQFSADPHEVEDWVQRTFIKAFSRLVSFEGRSRFSTWLFTIGLNEMRGDRRKTNVIPFERMEEAHHLAADSAVDHFEWNEVMRDLLSELDEVKKAVFLLHEIEGYSHAEIATMLDIQESASRTILTRTRSWLQSKVRNERRETG